MEEKEMAELEARVLDKLGVALEKAFKRWCFVVLLLAVAVSCVQILAK